MNELLCVVANNFSKKPRDHLIPILCAFYKHDEVCAAKKILMDIADSLSPKPDELKAIRSRAGDAKQRREAEDLLLIFATLDSRKAKLPMFYAADTSRIPDTREVELCLMAASVTAMTSKLVEINSTLQRVSDDSAVSATKLDSKADLIVSSISRAHDAGEAHSTALLNKIVDIDSKLSRAFDSDVPSMTGGSPSKGRASRGPTKGVTGGGNSEGESKGGKYVTGEEEGLGEGAEGRASSWSVMVRGRAVRESAAPSGQDGAVRKRGDAIPPRRIIVGARRPSVTTGSFKLAASTSAAKKMWHVFIGRLDKVTSESEIKGYLEENGMTGVEVRKLDALKAWQKESSAFRVSVDLKHKDEIMNAELWPGKVEVRDWFFKPKA